MEILPPETSFLCCRTAVNSASGVKTPAGGIFTGILVIVALALLTQWFYYIPQAALAGVIIMAVLDMVSFQLIPKLWRAKSKSLSPSLPLSLSLCSPFLPPFSLSLSIYRSLSLLWRHHHGRARHAVILDSSYPNSGGPRVSSLSLLPLSLFLSLSLSLSISTLALLSWLCWTWCPSSSHPNSGGPKVSVLCQSVHPSVCLSVRVSVHLNCPSRQS